MSNQSNAEPEHEQWTVMLRTESRITLLSDHVTPWHTDWHVQLKASDVCLYWYWCLPAHFLDRYKWFCSSQLASLKVGWEFYYILYTWLGYISIVPTPGKEITLERMPGMREVRDEQRLSPIIRCIGRSGWWWWLLTISTSCWFICIRTGSLNMFFMTGVSLFLTLFISRLEIISGSLGNPVIIHFIRIFNSINWTDLTCFQINLLSFSFLFTLLGLHHSYLVILGCVWWGANTFPGTEKESQPDFKGFDSAKLTISHLVSGSVLSIVFTSLHHQIDNQRIPGLSLSFLAFIDKTWWNSG